MDQKTRDELIARREHLRQQREQLERAEEALASSLGEAPRSATVRESTWDRVKVGLGVAGVLGFGYVLGRLSNPILIINGQV